MDLCIEVTGQWEMLLKYVCHLEIFGLCHCSSTHWNRCHLGGMLLDSNIQKQMLLGCLRFNILVCPSKFANHPCPCLSQPHKTVISACRWNMWSHYDIKGSVTMHIEATGPVNVWLHASCTARSASVAPHRLHIFFYKYTMMQASVLALAEHISSYTVQQ